MTVGGQSGSPVDDAVLRSLADARRRRILRELRELSGPVSVDDLARRLVADDRGCSPTDVASEAVRDRRAELLHGRLPQLESAGLVSVSDCEETVATTDHPALSAPSVRRVLDRETEAVDAALDCLADERRREILAVLVEDGGVTSRSELASELVERWQGGCESGTRREEGAERDHPEGRETASGDDERGSPDSDARGPGGRNRSMDTGEVVISLHHFHLPRLERANLVTYDPADGTISYVDHPLLDEGLLSDL